MDDKKHADKTLSLWHLTWPLFVELLLLMLMGNVDIFMLSTYSDDAVGAVGIANNYIQIAQVMLGFIATGAAVIIAQYVGAKNFKEAKQATAVAFYSATAFGVLISLAFLFLNQPMLRIMNLPEDMVGNTLTFLVWVGGFMFLQAILSIITTVLRSYGYTKETLYITVSMNMVNIVGNALFIFGWLGIPVLGVFGVAIATTFSRFLAVGFGFYLLLKRTGNPFENFKLKAFPTEYAKKMLAIGLPAAGENLSFTGGQTVMMALVTNMGAVVLTTHIYARQMNGFMLLIMYSVSQAGQIIIGQMMGAKRYEEIYHKCLYILRISLIASGLSSFVMFLFAKPILSIFTDNPEILSLGRAVFAIFILQELGRAFNVIIISNLRAVGEVKYPFIVGLIVQWGVGVGCALLFTLVFGWGLRGIVLATALDECVRGILMFFKWRSRTWMKVDDNLEVSKKSLAKT